MNLRQKTIIDLATAINENLFQDWFDVAEVAAFVDCESSFRAHATRFEPRLNESSYGLMQVLASTAAEVASDAYPDIGDTPERMYDPLIGLHIGMLVARSYWDQLAKRLGDDPTYNQWAASYNEGVGGVIRDEHLGRDPDPAYVNKWLAAFDHWSHEIYGGIKK